MKFLVLNVMHIITSSQSLAMRSKQLGESVGRFSYQKSLVHTPEACQSADRCGEWRMQAYAEFYIVQCLPRGNLLNGTLLQLGLQLRIKYLDNSR